MATRGPRLGSLKGIGGDACCGGDDDPQAKQRRPKGGIKVCVSSCMCVPCCFGSTPRALGKYYPQTATFAACRLDVLIMPPVGGQIQALFIACGDWDALVLFVL